MHSLTQTRRLFVYTSPMHERPQLRRERIWLGLAIAVATFTAVNVLFMGDHAKTHGINGHHPTIHLRVDDVDAMFAALPNKAQVVVEPESTHWGTRWFVMKDPDGNLYAFESSP